MLSIRSSIRAATGLAMALPALSLSSAALAQDQVDPQSLPPEYRTAPNATDITETTVGADGVETITRTRRIEASAPVTTEGDLYAPVPYSPSPAVFEREQWIEECQRRTSGRSEKEKGGIIGSLLGAVAGGIIGNRVADGDRLAGTLIGAGTGGIAGLLLGNLIGGGKKNDRYDCEAALDSYLSQYGTGPVRIASRSIAPPVGYAYPGYAPQGYYGYGYAPAYSYSYAPPQQVVYVPIRYEQQQRVVVRETVREETYQVPGAARVIPERAPSPKLIKQPTRVPAPAPRPTKLIKGQ